jgi:hypothetical protein
MRGYLALNFIARRVTLCFLFLLVFSKVAVAQSGSVYLAGGSATDSSSGPLNTLGAGVTLNTPSMGGFFGTVGGDVIFRHRIGAGAEYSFRKDRGPYAGLAYRPVFYDVNAVYYPLLNEGRRFIPELQGGVGRSKLIFYDTPSFCMIAPQGCPSTNAQIETLNHLQLHFSGGLRVSIWKGLFVRPQVDVRWIHDFTDFGRPVVVEYTFAVGYTFNSIRPKIPTKH